MAGTQQKYIFIYKLYEYIIRKQLKLIKINTSICFIGGP